MNRRAVGFGFIALSTLQFISLYLAAAIYGASQTTWSAELFHSLLGYVDQGLSLTAIISLVLGLIYLGWSELAGRGQSV